VIRVCSDILTRRESTINLEQKLRVRSFRSYSYFQEMTVDGILDAEKDAFVTTSLLSSEKPIERKKNVQCMQHFQVLREATLKLNLANEDIRSEKKSGK
jgi:hypothetical protein